MYYYSLKSFRNIVSILIKYNRMSFSSCINQNFDAKLNKVEITSLKADDLIVENLTVKNDLTVSNTMKQFDVQTNESVEKLLGNESITVGEY